MYKIVDVKSQMMMMMMMMMYKIVDVKSQMMMMMKMMMMMMMMVVVISIINDWLIDWLIDWLNHATRCLLASLFTVVLNKCQAAYKAYKLPNINLPTHLPTSLHCTWLYLIYINLHFPSFVIFLFYFIFCFIYLLVCLLHWQVVRARPTGWFKNAWCPGFKRKRNEKRSESSKHSPFH